MCQPRSMRKPALHAGFVSFAQGRGLDKFLNARPTGLSTRL